jgi:hypothetical protein
VAGLTSPDPDPDRIFGDVLEWIDGIKKNPELPDKLSANLVAAFAEGVRTGADGIVDDYLALLKPWGFDLAEVTCPTTVMVAQEDTNVPRRTADGSPNAYPRPGCS